MKKLLAIIALAPFISTVASEQKTIHAPQELKPKANTLETEKLSKQFSEVKKDALRILQELHALMTKSESEKIRSLAVTIEPISKNLDSFFEPFSEGISKEMGQFMELVMGISSFGNDELKNKLKEFQNKGDKLSEIRQKQRSADLDKK